MLSSSLKTKTIRSAALCAVLLFSPLAFCAWDKPTAQNQALISVGVLLAAPVVDGVLRNAKTLTSLDGWKNLPVALKAHIVQSLFAEGIAAREEGEHFLKHKMRVAGTYAKQNPVFLLALAAVIANAADSLNAEFKRLEKEANPTLASEFEAAKKTLAAAELARDTVTSKVSQLEQEVDAAKAAGAEDKQAMDAQLAATQREQAEATGALAALRTTHSRCTASALALNAQLHKATREQAEIQALHSNCETLIEALQARNVELTENLDQAHRNTSAEAGVGAGAGSTRSTVFDTGFGGAFRAASALRGAGATIPKNDS